MAASCKLAHSPIRPSATQPSALPEGGQTNRQQIVEIEQRVEIGGQRGARRNAAALRTRAAEARLESTRTLIDFEVARAYALAVAADRRAALARQAAAAFTDAGRVSERRLAAGDISVYADRRLRLEAARYAALEAEANLVRRSARIALSALLSASADSIGVTAAVLTDSLPIAVTPHRGGPAGRGSPQSCRL